MNSLKAHTLGSPEKLGLHFFYDATGQIAAVKMTRWLHARKVQLPLFRNRLEPNSAIAELKRSQFCVMILPARRQVP